ncbi:MAG TPA: carboxypeptidase-like regulatory domain-containing protein [Sphingomicrobium sp.]|nr:carboxypeptidase-like regulatory domain-containing protein [Sphingomicrobium sp.]
MATGRRWLRKAALLLALCAGGVAASTPPPGAAAAAWQADPDDQFLLDVNIRQLKLGEGVRAYNAPEGTCVVLGDFLTTLDVPMKIDLPAKQASGWAFKESNRISIDYAAGTAAYGATSERLAPGVIRETPEGWCVQTSALTRWFGIGVKPVTSGSVLVLESDAKLPVELAIERQKRAQSIRPARFDLASLPQVRLPYRMWRAPALDFVVNAGVTYRAKDGVRVDRSSSVYAAGEIAHLSYDAQVTTTRKGIPSTIRLHAYRSDPDGGLLGPLKATHFGFGDVQGFDSRLTGAPASGRGAVVTNRPLAVQTAFDRTRFEGDLPAGWEAEIYRNGELLGFAKADSSQRYVFDDVQLLYGENRVNIMLYGPQGQIRTREEVINIGQDNVPPGKTWYWAGFNQPGRDLLALHKPPGDSDEPKAQATVSLEHGLDDRTSVGMLARAMLINDEHVTFVEGSVRRSVGPAIVEVSAARESSGGMAARAQLLGKFGSINVSAEALLAKDFHLQGGKAQDLREARLALDTPIRIGRTVLPAHADVHLTDRLDGSKQLEAAARLSANLNRFNLSAEARYRKQFADSGPAPPNELNLGFIGSGRIGDVRLRGSTSFDVSPHARFRAAELSAYWSASDTADWEGVLAYDSSGHRGRVRITHVRRFDTMGIALTGEAATDGSVAVGINLNFSLDPTRGLQLSRRPLAQAGVVRATVYRDLNDNGVHDPAEPFEKGALITTGTKQADRPTDARGSVTIGGLAPFTAIAVGVDASSLDDPMLVPKTALQAVVPRPGVPAEIEIGLVGGGDIEGAVVKSGGIGFEGLDLELVDAAGKVVATARSDFDGFFLFERVSYGIYSVRVAKESAVAAKILPELNLRASVTAEKSIVRLGAVHVIPLPAVAASGAPTTSP